MIYLDNAATTLMYPEVRDTVSYYEKYFYNPSSPYSASKKNKKKNLKKQGQNWQI